MPQTLIRHRFSVDVYEQMIELGILTENDHVELIRGEIFTKMAIGDKHAAGVNRLNRHLGKAFSDCALVSVQNPVRLADSEPEPDIALLRPREDFYATCKPLPADILLLVEVSDTTLEYDQNVKGPMYAEAGITEYWIVNLTDDCLEVYRSPRPNGVYEDVQIFRRGEQVEIAALPGITLAVEDIL